MAQDTDHVDEDGVGDELGDEVFLDGSWDDLGEVPIQVDRDEDFVCKPCGDDEVIQDDMGEGFQIPKGVTDPKPPSREAVQKHHLTHWPYAPWCPHCR